MMNAIAVLPSKSRMVAASSAALGVSRASLHRRITRQKHSAGRPRRRPKPQRALSQPEHQALPDVLRSPRFADRAAAEIYARLFDQGIFLCSIRTMDRVLAAEAEVRERRRVLRHRAYKKPELLATGPNQVWSCRDNAFALR